MRKTGLEFAPGTTDDCKRLVGKMFKPDELFGAYRNARAEFGTTDIVLYTSDQDPAIHGGTRWQYAMHLKNVFKERASEFRLWKHSAQSVMLLPKESDAFWLVVDIRGADYPIMCVIYATPYEVEAVAP